MNKPKIEETNVIFMGNVFSLTISHLQRFLPEKNVIFYGVTEGTPLLDYMSLELTKDVTFITPSVYAKQCLQTVGIKVNDVIPHGIDLHPKHDEAFLERLKQMIPQPSKVEPTNVILCVAGNVQRKALDKLMIAYKTIQKIVKDAFLILHSGIGDTNIGALQTALDLKRFWWTNMWGVLDRYKLNSLYKLCDFYCQPSLVEGYGLTYLEAFAYDKPVIGVNCPATNEIIKDGYTGLLLPVTRTQDTIWRQHHALRLHHYDIDTLIDDILILTDQNSRINFKVNVKKEKRRWNINEIYNRFLKHLD